MRTTTRQIIIFSVLLIGFALLLSTYNMGSDVQKVDMKTLVSQIENGQVKHIAIDGDNLAIDLQDGKKERSIKEPGQTAAELFKDYSIAPDKIQAVAIEVREHSAISIFLANSAPYIVTFILLGGILFFMMRQVQGANSRAMSFGQSSAREYPKDQKNRVLFKDVAGVAEAKDELQEVVEFLKSPKKFVALGAKIPKGVLLMGSPGTGKTLLARAVAGEANVPFFSISGSEFVEMFVGVGASRVRDLFARAKKNAPCIVFVDEIDAVGRQRGGSGIGGSHDEREQTLNQILVEMDGFDANAGVIIMAATNRPDVLDPALLRPGRFDRRVILDLPDMNDREMILKIHARGKPMEPEVKFRTIAERTPGFSGADLMNIMNEAAILAARHNKKTIGMDELIPSVEKVMLGPERKSFLLSGEEKLITAYHEGGHALVAHELPYADDVHKVSVIPRGRAAGYTLKLPSEDRHMRQKQQFLDDIAVSLGGFVAEKMIFSDVTTGASNDLQVATHTAKSLVTQYGMSDKLGPRTFGEQGDMVYLGREMPEQRDYSDAFAEAIDNEVSRIISEQLKRTEDILTKDRVTLKLIADTLIVKENIEKEEFETLIGHKHAARPPRVPIV